MKHEETNAQPVSNTWLSLNKALRTANEAQASDMLREEKQGKSRLSYLLRIHQRYNSQRALREREELREIGKED